MLVDHRARGGSGVTGLSPAQRLLWDSFDATMREQVEHLPFRGEDERTASWMLSGGASRMGPGSTAALARLGYTGVEGRGWTSGEATDGPLLRGSPHPTGATTLGCWSFDPTDRSGCEKDCIEEMADDSSGFCDVFLDCGSATRTVSASELDALGDEVSGDTSLGFKHGPRIVGAVEGEEALITAAWNLLLQNLDLVVWAVCKTTGDVGTTEFAHLLDRINGSGGRRVTVHVTDFPGGFMALFGTSIVWASRDYLNDYMEMWTSGTDNERLCAALGLSAILVHELTHLAGYTYIDLGKACYVSYLIGNVFQWALAQRYPSAATECCENLAKDEVYGCGAAIHPEFSDCTSFHSGWEASKGVWESVVDVLAFVWDVIRLIVGGAVGAVHRAAEEIWDFIVDAIGTVSEAVKDGAEAVVDWVAETWEGLVDWIGGLFGGSGSGGCCGCSCEPCFNFCPDLWLDLGCSCTPKLDPDDERMMDCLIRCREEMMSHTGDPATTASATGEEGRGVVGGVSR